MGEHTLSGPLSDWFQHHEPKIPNLSISYPNTVIRVRMYFGIKFLPHRFDSFSVSAFAFSTGTSAFIFARHSGALVGLDLFLGRFVNASMISNCPSIVAISQIRYGL